MSSRHVACRGRLATSLLDAAARLSLKIDDDHVILDDQHLTKVKIAVMPNFHGIDIVWQQLTQSCGQGRSVRQQRIGELAVVLCQI